MRKYVKKHIKKTKKYIHTCKICKAMFKTKKELIEHKIYLHGMYPMSEHEKQNTDISELYCKYFKKIKKKSKRPQFNPKSSMDKYEDINLYGKLKIAGSKRLLEVYYLWDDRRQSYRKFTDDTIYGDFTEIIYDDSTLRYKIKNINRLRLDNIDNVENVKRKNSFELLLEANK